ncbi:MAG TPA: DUF222 domain-containing protein, partial [Actinoplanes sp.]|nr:DUF222 domain-containing protein [Actinoplanes sp.]
MLDTVHTWAEEAAKAADSALWPLSEAELLDLLHATHRLQQTLAALQIRVVREAACRALPAKHGHRTTATWLRDQLRIDPQPARDLTEAATLLDHRPEVERALISGSIDLRQATTIAAAVNAVPIALADAAAAADADTDATTAAPSAVADAHAATAVPSALAATRAATIASRAEATLIDMA